VTGDARYPPKGWRILIAGTGGQGVLTAANLLTDFFVQKGHDVTSGQVHGMAQRGGSVQSSVMVDCGINPAVPIGGADVVLGLEPVETVRALTFISSRTTVFMNTAPVIPFTLDQQRVRGKSDARYPDVGELAARIRSIASDLLTLDATHLAQQAGSVKALNMVMLGCWLGSGLYPINAEEFKDSILAGAPAGVAEVNAKAFLSGVEVGKTAPVTKGTP
jgi:indolepyruvate ferredoxin oxidoreductase beta subunit